MPKLSDNTVFLGGMPVLAGSGACTMLLDSRVLRVIRHAVWHKSVILFLHADSVKVAPAGVWHAVRARVFVGANIYHESRTLLEFCPK